MAARCRRAAGERFDIGSAATDQRRVGFAARKNLFGAIFARIEPWIAARQIHGRRRAGPRTDDAGRAGRIAVAEQRRGGGPRVGVEIANQRPQGIDLNVSGPGVAQTRRRTESPRTSLASADRTNLARRRARCPFRPARRRPSARRRAPGAQDPQGLEIAAGRQRKKQIGLFRAFRAAGVDHHASPVRAAAGDKPSPRRQAVSAEVPGMRDQRIGPPHQHQVGAVGDLAQRTGHFAHGVQATCRPGRHWLRWRCPARRQSNRRCRRPAARPRNWFAPAHRPADSGPRPKAAPPARFPRPGWRADRPPGSSGRRGSVGSTNQASAQLAGTAGPRQFGCRGRSTRYRRRRSRNRHRSRRARSDHSDSDAESAFNESSPCASKCRPAVARARNPTTSLRGLFDGFSASF